jgi:hypothetical protein
MLNKNDIKKLVRCFLHEACGYLEIDDSQIPIAYMPMPVSLMMVMLLKDADAIVIDTNILNAIARKNWYTLLRIDVYRVSRQIFQRRKHQATGIDIDEDTNAKDAQAFAYALCFLNGLCITIPKAHQELTPMIRSILNDEFHEDCVLHFSPDPQFPGEFSYRTKKTKNAKNVETKSHKSVKPILYSSSVSNGEKGTRENPFDNVLDACRFIKKLEKDVFGQDSYMCKTLAQRRFNYCPEVNIYNIKWADGKGAYCHPEIPEDAFIINQLVSGKFSLKPNLYGRKFLYRGQSKFYENCTPGLFRNSKQDYFLKELILYDELRAVLASHPLVQLFEKSFDLWHDKFRFEVNYGGLAQHYYNKTRYLDLTSDIEAATFFAIVDYDFEKDEYTPHTDTNDLGVMYYYELAEPGAFRPQNHQHLSTIGKQIFMRSGSQHGFLLNMDKGANFNLFPQVRMVFFRHDPLISRQIFYETNSGEKFFPSDILQIQWKRFMQQFESIPTVSLEAVKINVSDNLSKHETINSISRKLENLYGIKVDKKSKPSFDADLLDQYYGDIKNGWWQDVFCKDIFFPSSDGIVYKDMLLRLPEDQRYKKYFTKS